MCCSVFLLFWFCSRRQVSITSAATRFSARSLSSPDGTWEFFGQYTGLLLVAGFSIIVRQLFMRHLSLASSMKIHNGALWGVLRSPMSWHDVTPNGQKINRFSSDMEQVDSNLQGSVSSLLLNFSNLVGSLVLVACICPYVLAVVPFLGVFYYRTQRSFRNSTRELQRLERKSRSPHCAVHRGGTGRQGDDPRFQQIR